MPRFDCIVSNASGVSDDTIGAVTEALEREDCEVGSEVERPSRGCIRLDVRRQRGWPPELRVAEHDVNCLRRLSRGPKLLVVDLDAIVESDVLDVLAALNGKEAEAEAIASRARSHRDGPKTLRDRVALLAGLSLDQVEASARQVAIAAGTTTLVRAVRMARMETVLLSHGPAELCARVADEAWFHRYRGNELAAKDGALTGELAEPALDAKGKLDVVREHCEVSGIALGDVVFIGAANHDPKPAKAAKLSVIMGERDTHHRANHPRGVAALEHTSIRAVMHILRARPVYGRGAAARPEPLVRL